MSGRRWGNRDKRPAKKSSDERYQELKAELRDFGLSINSFREIFKAKSTGWKIIWTALGLAALTWCMRESIVLITRLAESPTATSIEYKVTSAVTFPVVTVCTYARVNNSQIARYNISSELLSYMFASFKGLYFFYNDGANQQERAPELEVEYQAFLDQQPQGFSLHTFFLNHGTYCEQFLSACLFQGNEFDCCDPKITHEILTDIGKCFVIDTKEPEQMIPGEVGGLKIYISSWEENYPETVINTNPDTGVQIHISHPKEQQEVTAQPIVLLTNTHALVELNLVNQILEPQTEHTTRRKTCTYDQKPEFFPSYSPESCFEECVAKLTLQRCNCIQIGTVPISENLNADQFCSPEVATTCVQPLLQDNNRSFLWDLYEIKNTCSCPLKCDRWYYETLVSYSSVPSPGFKEAWLNSDEWITERTEISNVTIDKNSFIILDVYFNSLSYRVVFEQAVFGLNDFLSNLGGQLSVWVGIRLLTIFQLFYYTVLACIVILPVMVRRFFDRHGLFKKLARAGTVREFKKPVSLYPTASQGLFDASVLPSAAAILSYPALSSSRNSSLYSDGTDRDDLMARQNNTAGRNSSIRGLGQFNPAFQPDSLSEKDEESVTGVGHRESEETPDFHAETNREGDLRF